MISDLRFALRQLLKSPSFTIVAVLTLALGIGANTAIFSLVNALLFRPLPFRQAGRLVWIANTAPAGAGLSGGASRRTTLREWRELNKTFEGLAGYHAFFDRVDSILTGNGESVRLRSVVVTGNFLEVLGVQPQLGRGFVDEECQADGPKAVLLTDRFWKQRFQADPSILGRAININNSPWTVVGILPASFEFSSMFSPGSESVDFLRPAAPVTESKDTAGNIMAVIGRLKPGVNLSRAQNEFELLNQQLRSTYPERASDYCARLIPLREHISGRFGPALLVLSGAVGCVLLIACTNLSNLLLARAAARRKEIAVRAALGAGRLRLIRQMLTESILLSCFGAALGVPLAFLATNAIARSHAFSLPLLSAARVDGLALGFTLFVAVSTGLLFGMVPALQVAAVDVREALQAAGRGSSHTLSLVWIRQALAISQVALACMLLVGAGLLIRSFVRLLDVDPGFQPEKVAAWRIVLSGRVMTNMPPTAFYGELVRQIEALPGVESAGLTGSLPLSANETLHVHAKGKTYRSNEIPLVFVHQVNQGYFKTLRIRLLAGRDFSSHDIAETREKLVVVINQKMAHSLWPGEDALGQILRIDDDPGAEWKVVGVVGDVRQDGLDEQAPPEMYMTGRRWAQELVVRSKDSLASIVPIVRATLREISPYMAVDEFRSLDDVVAKAVSPKRLTTLLLGLFSLQALLLVSLGIYGVIAYSVSQRIREIGIRLALGSSKAAVLRLIIHEGMKVGFVGCTIGLMGALALTRVIQSLLFHVSPSDPLTFGASGLLVLLVALLASWLPARRAAKVDPMVALRCE